MSDEPETLDDLSAHRLRRADLDSFERGLRRRRTVVWLGAAALLLGGAGAAGWALTRTPGVGDDEREPNDDGGHANPIELARPIHGLLGKRRSRTESDRDVYRLAAPNGGSAIYTIEATALPNVDLQLTVNDGAGAVVAVVDEAPTGGREVLRRRRIGGPLTITVDEHLPAGGLPVENVSDTYALTVTTEADDGGEVEPNGGGADATALVPTREVRGWLDGRQDVDVLRWDGADGTYDLSLKRGNLPLVWRLADGQQHNSDTGRVTLKKGDLIRLERSDAGRDHGETLPGIDTPWSIVVTPAGP